MCWVHSWNLYSDSSLRDVNCRRRLLLYGLHEHTKLMNAEPSNWAAQRLPKSNFSQGLTVEVVLFSRQRNRMKRPEESKKQEYLSHGLFKCINSNRLRSNVIGKNSERLGLSDPDSFCSRVTTLWTCDCCQANFVRKSLRLKLLGTSATKKNFWGLSLATSKSF